jgi:hypothetical protein
MRTSSAAITLALLLSCSSASAGDVTVVMHDGRVTLRAENVPLRQILAEWARVGQTRIVGAERLAGTPLTLQLENVPERQALETLLRSASGYMAAPRSLPDGSASMYDRIMILPTSSAPAATAAAAPGRRGNMPPVMAPQPPAEEANEAAQEQSDVPEDFDAALRRGEDPGAMPGTEEQPAEATFDYANPQLMLQQRQQQLEQQQQQNVPPGAGRPGEIIQPPNPTPNVFPGTVGPASGQGTVTTTARPGEIVAPPQPQNPYGLPPGVQPGSVQGSPVQPDRAKYMNPYQPTQSQPPGDR